MGIGEIILWIAAGMVVITGLILGAAWVEENMYPHYAVWRARRRWQKDRARLDEHAIDPGEHPGPYLVKGRKDDCSGK